MNIIDTTIKFLAILSFAILSLSGCNTDDEKSSDFLTSKTWKRGLIDKNPSSNPEGALYYGVQSCEMDDTFKFGSDGKVILDRKIEKCDQSEVQTETLTYLLNTSAKEFTLDGTRYTLAEASESQIKYYVAIPAQTGYGTLIFLLQ